MRSRENFTYAKQFNTQQTVLPSRKINISKVNKRKLLEAVTVIQNVKCVYLSTINITVDRTVPCQRLCFMLFADKPICVNFTAVLFTLSIRLLRLMDALCNQLVAVDKAVKLSGIIDWFSKAKRKRIGFYLNKNKFGVCLRFADC